MEIEIGKELPAWTMHTCDLCGIGYYITRTTCKIVTELDLICSDCVEENVLADKDELIHELTEQNKQLINALRNVMNAAAHLDYDIYQEFGGVGSEYEENKAITIARNLLKDISGDSNDQ